MYQLQVKKKNRPIAGRESNRQDPDKHHITAWRAHFYKNRQWLA